MLLSSSQKLYTFCKCTWTTAVRAKMGSEMASTFKKIFSTLFMPSESTNWLVKKGFVICLLKKLLKQHNVHHLLPFVTVKMFPYPSDLFCYRIIEIFRLEKTFKSPAINPAVLCPPVNRCATPTHLLNTSGADDSTTSMVSLFQCLTTLLMKKLFLIQPDASLVQLQLIFPFFCH